MTTESIQPCAVIPVYNHPQVLPRIVRELLENDLPVVLVDDGSDDPCRTVIEGIVASCDRVQLVKRRVNGGKGAALKDGLRAALQQGFSHAIQIDADGQHNTGDIDRFLDTMRRQPEALVAGYPAYDASVPRHRYYARYATHIWVWINTLSLQVHDAMCGFRVYPLVSSCALLDRYVMGDRMDFDVEFIVRWVASGLPIKQLQTRVTYPQDGVSHFRLWRDNALISRMHARLFFSMLLHLPARLAGRLRRPEQTS